MLPKPVEAQWVRARILADIDAKLRHQGLRLAEATTCVAIAGGSGGLLGAKVEFEKPNRSGSTNGCIRPSNL